MHSFTCTGVPNLIYTKGSLARQHMDVHAPTTRSAVSADTAPCVEGSAAVTNKSEERTSEHLQAILTRLKVGGASNFLPLCVFSVLTMRGDPVLIVASDACATIPAFPSR